MPNQNVRRGPSLMPRFYGSGDWRSGMTCGSSSGSEPPRKAGSAQTHKPAGCFGSLSRTSSPCHTQSFTASVDVILKESFLCSAIIPNSKKGSCGMTFYFLKKAMKTHKQLFAKIVAFENLLLAAQKAAAGKREQFHVMDFFHRLEENLWRLQEELATKTYQPSQYYAAATCRRAPS
jgi:hypothetical protein